MRPRHLALVLAFLLLGVAADTASAAAPELAVTRVRPAWTGISLVSLDGTVTALTRHPGWQDDDPSWSPDGRRIAFTRSRDGYRSFHVFVMRADGSHVRRVTSGRGDERPAWSPDGHWIAYGSTSGIRLVRPNGRSDHAVHGTGDATWPAWSADGTRLLYTKGAWIVSARRDGTHRKRLVRGREGAASPDGRTLAYTGPAGGVFVAPAAGGAGHMLHRGMQPGWSTDSSLLAFARWPQLNRFAVWVMNADGSGAYRLLADARAPAWRP